MNYDKASKLKLPISLNKINVNTIAQNTECLGLVTVPITIGSITQKCEIHLIKNSNHELLIGLDLISQFYLSMNNNFRIFQAIDDNSEEILSNYCNNNLNNHTYNSNKFNFINELKYELNYIVKKSSNDNIIINNLNDIQSKQLNKLLTKYSKAFSKDKFDIGSISTEIAKISLSNNIPINLRPYRCNARDQQTIDTQINKLLELDLIRKSVSPYAFPITLADKKDEGKKNPLNH